MSSNRSHSVAGEWLPTTQAAHQLGISPCTLKRYFKRDGLLQEGLHLTRGERSNQPHLWHVRRCREALRAERGTSITQL